MLRIFLEKQAKMHIFACFWEQRQLPSVRRILLPLLLEIYGSTMLFSDAARHRACKFRFGQTMGHTCHRRLSSALVVAFVCPAFIFRLHCVVFLRTGIVQTKTTPNGVLESVCSANGSEVFESTAPTTVKMLIWIFVKSRKYHELALEKLQDLFAM